MGDVSSGSSARIGLRPIHITECSERLTLSSRTGVAVGADQVPVPTGLQALAGSISDLAQWRCIRTSSDRSSPVRLAALQRSMRSCVTQLSKVLASTPSSRAIHYEMANAA